MHTTRTYGPAVVATMLLGILVLALYPYLQYYIDPDATAYLTIAKRYAAGDYTKAINGYWNPWSCWLTAILIKGGMAPFSAAIVINALGAAGFLFISQSLFNLFGLQQKMQWLLCATLAVFLSYAVFRQTFDDLWQCVFLLCSLRLMLVDKYTSNAWMWIANGIIGALAYFAKAYAFPFFILNTVCCSFLLTRAWERPNRLQWIRMSAVAVAALLLCSLPWIWLLHNKYGIWTTSTAGTLNSSWYLTGHPYWKEGIHLLVPPIYADSPYYWEDPYLVNGIAPHFWDSPKLFALQLVKCVYNLLKMVKAMNELSAFFLLTWITAIGILVSGNLRSYFNDNRLAVAALSFFLFPLAFLLINFEARYIWYMLPLSMVAGALLVSRINIGPALKTALAFVFAFSYIVWPVWDMKDMINKGENEYMATRQLKRLNVRGSFTTNVVYGPQMPVIARLAYFSGNPYYNIPQSSFSKHNLLAGMRRYHVRYYFYHYSGIDCDDYIFSDEYGKPFPEVSNGHIKGFKIFLVNP